MEILKTLKKRYKDGKTTRGMMKYLPTQVFINKREYNDVYNNTKNMVKSGDVAGADKYVEDQLKGKSMVADKEGRSMRADYLRKSLRNKRAGKNPS